MQIIGLIQARPQEFRLDGQQRLKVVRSLPDLDSRSELVSELLKRFRV